MITMIRLKILKQLVKLHRGQGVDHERFMKDFKAITTFINEDIPSTKGDGNTNPNNTIQ